MAEEEKIQNAPGEAEREDLYSRHVEEFVSLAQKDPDLALQCYGFTVWHSVPAKEAALLSERIGMEPRDATDLYNRGTAHAMEGEYEKAVEQLKAALAKDPDHALAAFNLAVCLENLERIGEARKAYERYLEILDRAEGRPDFPVGDEAEIEEEKARVREHLKELGEK